MGEVLYEAIRLHNLPFTVLLCIVMLFWALVIAGFFDVESLDFEVGEIGEFFSFGKVPFSVWLSIFAIQLWFYTIMLNYVLNLVLPLHSIFRLLGALFVIAPVSGLLTKGFVKPMEKMFIDHEDQFSNLSGKRCTVTSSKVTMSYGTAEIETDGSPLLINIRADESDMIEKGDEVLVIDHDAEKDTYMVSRF